MDEKLITPETLQEKLNSQQRVFILEVMPSERSRHRCLSFGPTHQDVIRKALTTVSSSPNLKLAEVIVQ